MARTRSNSGKLHSRCRRHPASWRGLRRPWPPKRGSSARERRSATRPVPRLAPREPEAAPHPVPAALTRMPITSAHSWANASDVPLSAGAAGPPARSPSMPRPSRQISAGSPPPPVRPAPPCLPRPAPGHRGPAPPPPLKLSAQQQGGWRRGGATAARRGRPPGGGETAKPLLLFPQPPTGPAPPHPGSPAARGRPGAATKGPSAAPAGPGPESGELRLGPAGDVRQPGQGLLLTGLPLSRRLTWLPGAPAAKSAAFLNTMGRRAGKGCQPRPLQGRPTKRRPVNSDFEFKYPYRIVLLRRGATGHRSHRENQSCPCGGTVEMLPSSMPPASYCSPQL